MNIPNEIRIGEILYKVEKCDIPENMVRKFGVTDSINSRIDINTSLNQDVQEKTFIHECLHGIIQEYGITFESVDEEEEIVRQFETGIYSLVKQLLEANEIQMAGKAYEESKNSKF